MAACMHDAPYSTLQKWHKQMLVHKGSWDAFVSSVPPPDEASDEEAHEKELRSRRQRIVDALAVRLQDKDNDSECKASGERER